MCPREYLTAQSGAQCIAKHLAEGANSWVKGCEHFGDNILKLACIQYKVSLKCLQREGRPPFQLDDHLKNLLRELGHAINDTVSESDRITGAIAGVRAHAYDIVLKSDATSGWPSATRQPRRRPAQNSLRRIAAFWNRCAFRWTRNPSIKTAKKDLWRVSP